MSPASESFPLPVNAPTRRLESIDLLRGVLMILMALDHTKDYFSSVVGIDSTDAAHSWPALFVTRWVTHICAPGFVALAGTSVYLQRERGKTHGKLAKLLVTRGLWLMLLEITLISFGWSFSFAPGLQVIWAVGVSMVLLAALLRLPVAAIGGIGAVIVLLHNLLDPIRARSLGDWANGWKLLHERAPLIVHHQFVGMVAYPIVPWIGVICLGYAFGPVVTRAPARRQRTAMVLGMAMMVVFAVLRITHGYGDHDVFRSLVSAGRTTMSFFEVEKYPPSLQYLLATLGINLLLYALADVGVSQGWVPRVRAFLETYGRVPFFYYVLHIYLLHAAALLLSAAEHLNWRFWLVPGAVFTGHLQGWGFDLPGVYLVWACVVLVLYLPCRWFARLKARRRDWWLSYL